MAEIMMDKCYVSGFVLIIGPPIWVCGGVGKVTSNPLVLLFMVTEEWLRLESQFCLLASENLQTDGVLSLTSTAKAAQPQIFI